MVHQTPSCCRRRTGASAFVHSLSWCAPCVVSSHTGNRFDDQWDAPLWTLLPLPNIKSLHLSRNMFVGDRVDLSWSSFPVLVDLNLSSNRFLGPLTVGAASNNMGILDVSGNRWACFLPEFPSGMRVMASCSLFQRATPLVRVMWRS
jgi:hypothetical protein